MKVCTWNVNGIRAREGQVLDWLLTERPDVLCLQEIKASPDAVPPALCALEGYWCYWHGHKGYSGVGLHLRKETFPVRPRFEHPAFDHEHRIVTARVGAWVFASIYVPNGGKDFPAKVRFLEALGQFVSDEHAAGRTLILCGDLNVAREERDVHPSLRKSEQIGQTPGERELLSGIIARGLVDLHRVFEPENDRLYTWWAPWRNLREKNVGWRLDYVLPTAELAGTAKRCASFREFGTSDHAPVLAEFDAAPPRAEAPSEAPPVPSREEPEVSRASALPGAVTSPREKRAPGTTQLGFEFDSDEPT